MQTLNKHLARGFLLTFTMTMVIVTFVMCIGIVFKVTDLIARGVSWRPVVRLLIYGLPQALTYSIPISVLTSSLLVFGRLSADGEITAMKATGISLWRIVRVPILIALWFSVFCFYVINVLVPKGHLNFRVETSRMGMETPMELLEEGRFMQSFPGMTIYIGRKKGNLLGDVRIYDLRTRGVKREVRATSGIVKQGADKADLVIDLFDVRIDPFSDDRPGAAYCEKWSLAIPKAAGASHYAPTKDDKTMWDLLWEIDHIEERFPELNEEDRWRERSLLIVEIHKRMVMSLTCVAFAFLGIPLGIKAHRKESSVGVGVSLILVVNFYLFVIIAETLARRPEFLPHLIIWLPIVIAIVLGGWLIHRNN